jgi:hypothetical protein
VQNERKNHREEEKEREGPRGIIMFTPGKEQ